MKTFGTSPCQRLGISPDGSKFPCLEDGWGERVCPMNSACKGWVEARGSIMYRLGYPHAAWVVRKKFFGHVTECTLQFMREPATKEHAQSIYGDGVLRVSPAT